MALKSIKSILAEASLVSPEQFVEWSKAWRVAVENGSTESMLAFFARESGISEEVFLQRLAEKLGWPFLDLPRVTVTSEAQKRISTKVAFQYGVMPTKVEFGVLQAAVSNPFDSALLNTVQFDAGCTVQFGLAPRDEIDKALKRYYGVGAETLDQMAEEE